jgi:hypothetical protein
MTWAREAEECPLLEAVAKERLVKTQKAEKSLAGAVVICELWRLAVALLLLVVSSRECINTRTQLSNSKPVYSHTYYFM